VEAGGTDDHKDSPEGSDDVPAGGFDRRAKPKRTRYLRAVAMVAVGLAAFKVGTRLNHDVDDRTWNLDDTGVHSQGTVVAAKRQARGRPRG
jgi:hypothetical protein